ncbi:5314_t:CDS:1 [Acaulospora morrowiae]|uniref:5314_t:CDS:1 n=1 Tax=Acaulospora morrowiae TaxID=94023 RepID=A0A9N8W0K9_9GLOM|nr:5314_t:CDS:1 [Acaulospora morrowiae]
MLHPLLPGHLTSSRHSLNSLSNDILYIIIEELDFLSTLFLRLTCRSIYLAFSDTILFSCVSLPSSFTQRQFNSLFSYLRSTQKLRLIRQLTFDRSKVTSDAVISVLRDCENIQYLCILGCRDVSIPPITDAIVDWYDEYEGSHEGDSAFGNKIRMGKLEKIVMTRCIGGKRHSLFIKKILEDLKRMKDHRKKNDELNSDAFECHYTGGINTISTISSSMSVISAALSNNSPSICLPAPVTSKEITGDDTNDGIFQFQSCSDPNCEPCTLSCAECGIKYKYWDEFWIKCHWCKNRHFCGACITEASRRSVFRDYSFRYERIKLCQLFDVPCPK